MVYTTAATRRFWQYAGDILLHAYSTNGFFTVPTVKERQGDFSDLLALGSQYQLYDPYSGTLGANGCGHRGSRSRGNRSLPSNRLSPVCPETSRLLIPCPTTPGTSNGSQQLYRRAEQFESNMAQQHSVALHATGDRPNNRAFRLIQPVLPVCAPDDYLGKPLGDIYPTGGFRPTATQGGSLDDVITPAPNRLWFWTSRYGFVRFQAYRPHTSLGV
jgi:hypothetical protein